MLIGAGLTGTAQQRLLNMDRQERLRLRDLNLTDDQKRRLALLVQRERLQFYLNQKDLNSILTDKQKALLLEWKNKRMTSPQDSTKKANRPIG
jgi:Spy/CpxP family protein refolding chaperone